MVRPVRAPARTSTFMCSYSTVSFRATSSAARVLFHPAPAPTLADLNGIVERTRRRTTKWLGQHGYLDEGPLEERSNELPAQTALDACATIAMCRGNVPRPYHARTRPTRPMTITNSSPTRRRSPSSRTALTCTLACGSQRATTWVERLCRYAARPPISLERLRRLPGGPHRVPSAAGAQTPPDPGDVIRLAPNVISVRHWDRLLGGLLYAVQPRVDWATLLRRSFYERHGMPEVPRPTAHDCRDHPEREPVGRILAHLGMPTEPPPVARARDPTDDAEETGDGNQLSLGLA